MITEALTIPGSEGAGIEYFTLEDLLRGIKKHVKESVDLLTVEDFRVGLEGFPSLLSRKMTHINVSGVDITAQEEANWNNSYKEKGFIEPTIVRDKLIPFLVCKALSGEIREHEAITIVQKTQCPPNTWISNEQYLQGKALADPTYYTRATKGNSGDDLPIVPIVVGNRKIEKLFADLLTRNRDFLRRRPISVDQFESSEDQAIEMTVKYMGEGYRMFVTELVRPNTQVRL